MVKHFNVVNSIKKSLCFPYLQKQMRKVKIRYYIYIFFKEKSKINFKFGWGIDTFIQMQD